MTRKTPKLTILLPIFLPLKNWSLRYGWHIIDKPSLCRLGSSDLVVVSNSDWVLFPISAKSSWTDRKINLSKTDSISN